MDTVARLKEVVKTFIETDSGAVGKAFEIVLREYIQPKSKRNNGKVTKQNTTYGDLRVKTQFNANTKIEIKSACGELGIINNDIVDDETDTDDLDISDYILTKANLIIYTPTVDIEYPLEKQAYIFTRDEFLAMVNNYNGSGKILRVKTSTNGLTVISFQSFYCETRQKASKKIATYLNDCCICQPTVEEYFNR